MKTPSAAGMNMEALERLHRAMDRLIESRRVPGAVVMIERRGVSACFECFGKRDPLSGVLMQKDSIFRIYSMTKPIVSVALMMLAENGRVLLRDPVAKYVPVFEDAKLGVERAGVLDVVVPPRAMTVYDLLRHTAGLTYEYHAPSIVRQRYVDANLFSLERSNAEHCERLAALPLMHAPGSVWDYSRATDVLGRVIEVIAGVPLGDHLQAAIFGPLGMVDTGFTVPAADRDRIAEPFSRNPDSGLPAPLFDACRPAPLQSGGAGLMSTAADYSRFLRMLLNRGELDGVRLLGRKTIEYMTADHLGSLPRSGDALPPDHGFGLGFAVKTALGGHTEPGSIGSYGWSGSAGTAFFVDPAESMFAFILVQAPGLLDEVRELFRQLVYAAIDD